MSEKPYLVMSDAYPRFRRATPGRLEAWKPPHAH
jgi:hypothetical protein